MTACKGPVGPQGKPGVANISVKKIDFKSSDLARDPQNAHVAGASYKISSITPAVVDSGAVFSYLQSGKGWITLPYTYPGNNNTINFTYGYVVGRYEFSIAVEDTASLYSAGQAFSGDSIKVVVIPPSKMNSVSGESPKQVLDMVGNNKLRHY